MWQAITGVDTSVLACCAIWCEAKPTFLFREPRRVCYYCTDHAVQVSLARMEHLPDLPSEPDPKISPKANPWKPMTNQLDLAVIGKLGEECNELGSAVMRCIIQGINEKEPVTDKLNKVWLQDEIADVLANIELVMPHFQLDYNHIVARVARKKEYLRSWHTMFDDTVRTAHKGCVSDTGPAVRSEQIGLWISEKDIVTDYTGPTTRSGLFHPKRLDTLRVAMQNLIGKRFEFEFRGISDVDEPYPRQTRWMISRKHDAELTEKQIGRWMPAEDILFDD